MCFNNNRKVIPKLMIPLEIIFWLISEHLLVWHSLGCQVFIIYSICTHTYIHTHITQPKDYAPKTVEKSIMNDFSTRSLEEVL